MTRRIRNLSLIALALAAAACGGGGSSGTTTITNAAVPITTGLEVNTDANNLPKSISDTVVAIKLAANLVEWGPVGLNAIRERTNPVADWSFATSTKRSGCELIEATNADSLPTVGDKVKSTYIGCKIAHLSGTLYTFNVTADEELLSLSSLTSLASESWTSSSKADIATSGEFAAIQLGGKYNIDAKHQSKAAFTYKANHFADDTQIDEMAATNIGTEVSALGNSEVNVKTAYSCRYAIGAATNPDCSDVRTTLIGKIYGVPITAVMTRISASPVIFQIESGSVKFNLELITYSSNVNRKLFKLTTPTGEIVNLTGEDTNWLRI
jgi:hypothetical protein